MGASKTQLASPREHISGGDGIGRAAVLRPWFKRGKLKTPRSSAQAALAEGASLAAAIDLDVLHSEVVAVAQARPATMFGAGVVENFVHLFGVLKIDLVVVDAPLTPVQQRNLEQVWNCKVIDRTGLILEIFGARARTREGQLQVELAALSYQRSRLVRSWTHLERQRGALGFVGGPGESQLEIDRRLIGNRITKLKRRLEQVSRTRGLHRAARKRVPYPIVALVGYTNAGKSTLFNRLTRSAQFAHDQLFATLDPTMRGLKLPSGRQVIISDTVGFISDLPTDLVAAFSATLEEVVAADLVVHVRDISHPDSETQKKDVVAVLSDLASSHGGVDDEQDEDGDACRDGSARLSALGSGVALEALNKVDRLEAGDRQAILEPKGNGRNLIAISALTGEGIDTLAAAIDATLAQSGTEIRVDVDHADGASLAWLYRCGSVLERHDDEAAIHLLVRLERADLARLARRDGITLLH